MESVLKPVLQEFKSKSEISALIVTAGAKHAKTSPPNAPLAPILFIYFLTSALPLAL
jgi:hypothetical protein